MFVDSNTKNRTKASPDHAQLLKICFVVVVIAVACCC